MGEAELQAHWLAFFRVVWPSLAPLPSGRSQIFTSHCEKGNFLSGFPPNHGSTSVSTQPRALSDLRLGTGHWVTRSVLKPPLTALTQKRYFSALSGEHRWLKKTWVQVDI